MDFGRALCLLQDGLSPPCRLPSKECRHRSEGKSTSSLIRLTIGECNEQSNRNKKQGSYYLQWIIHCIHCNLFDDFNSVLVRLGSKLLNPVYCRLAGRRFHSPLSACLSSSRILFSRSLRRSRNCHKANATTPPKTRKSSMTMMGANSLMAWIGIPHSGNHTARLAPT